MSMNIKKLIGVNAFETAENVYVVVILHESTGVDIDILVACNNSILGIADVPFAQTLFQYLTNHQDKQESLVDLFFKNYLTGMSPMRSLSESVKALNI